MAEKNSTEAPLKGSYISKYSGEEIDALLGRAASSVNQNLLLNWYFRHPVNRNGKSEYAGSGYTIDLWRSAGTGTTIIYDDKIVFEVQENNYSNLTQFIKNPSQYIGKTLTFSILGKAISGNPAIFVPFHRTVELTNEISVVSITFVFGSAANEDTNNLQVSVWSNGVASSAEMIAAKLELGDHQTLARQNDDGEWEIIDPPDYDLQYALCSLYSPITGEWVGNQHSDTNLLDNAYWASSDAIIDQRRGMIVPSGTEYFTPSASEWSRVGYTDKYYKVDGVLTNGITNLITIDSVQYMVRAEDCVRGYTGSSYGIDRWRAYVANVELTANGLKMTTTAAFGRIIQDIDRPGLTNQVLTFSVLYSGLSLGGVRLYYGPGDHLLATSSETSGLISGTFIFPADAAGAVNVFIALESKDASVNLIASGLDYGPVQTLAHQDADGNWVLNDPPPDKALELVKCQWYARNIKAITGGARYGQGHAITSTQAFMIVELGVGLRITPSVIKRGTLWLISAGSPVAVTSISVGAYADGIVTLTCNTDGGLTPGSVYELMDNNTGTSSIFFDANL